MVADLRRSVPSIMSRKPGQPHCGSVCTNYYKLTGFGGGGGGGGVQFYYPATFKISMASGNIWE